MRSGDSNSQAVWPKGNPARRGKRAHLLAPLLRLRSLLSSAGSALPFPERTLNNPLWGSCTAPPDPHARQLSLPRGGSEHSRACPLPFPLRDHLTRPRGAPRAPGPLCPLLTAAARSRSGPGAAPPAAASASGASARPQGRARSRRGGARPGTAPPALGAGATGGRGAALRCAPQIRCCF